MATEDVHLGNSKNIPRANGEKSENLEWPSWDSVVEEDFEELVLEDLRKEFGRENECYWKIFASGICWWN